MNNKERALKVAGLLLESKAVQINTEELFTFSSGIQSPIYCDNRLLIGIPKVREEISQYFIELIDDSVDIIAGTATAGIPWASFIAQILKKPLCYVRSSKKGHGTGKLLEGSQVKNKNVVLIEDLITSGESALNACQTLLNEEARSIKTLGIFTYGFKKAFDSYSNMNLSFETLSSLEFLLTYGEEKNILSSKDIEIVQKWKKNKDN